MPNDFKEKQILFLNTLFNSFCDLKLNNNNLLIIKKDKKDKVPVNNLLSVFIIGDFTITSKIINKLVKNNISLFFLNRNLSVYSSINVGAEGNFLLREKQYCLFDNEKKLFFSKFVVKNKIINQLSLLRSVKINDINNKTRKEFKKELFEKIDKAKNINSLRGIEGSVTKEFFKLYFIDINWYKRLPRMKIDENNILLDIGYNFLFNFVDTILRLYGFDTYKGFYHQLFFQRKSLACDLMEPFRCIIERALLKMHNLKQFNKNDFSYKNNRYVLNYKESIKYIRIFLREILSYKMEIYHYIRNFYYNVMNDNKINFFIIR